MAKKGKKSGKKKGLLKSIFSMNFRQAAELYIAGEGIVETARRAAPAVQHIVKGENLQMPTVNEVAYILGPAADGALASRGFHAAATSSLTDPLVKGAMNIQPLKGAKIPRITLKGLVRGAPSAFGWKAAWDRYRDHKKVWEAQGALNPRTAAMTGIAVNPTSTSITVAATRNTVLDSAAVPFALGGGASKAAGAAMSSGLVPSPLKRILNAPIIKGRK